MSVDNSPPEDTRHSAHSHFDSDAAGTYVVAELADQRERERRGQPQTPAEPPHRPPRARRIALPIGLFIVTCFSTFWVGASQWQPTGFLEPGTLMPVRQALIRNWDQGLIYMACVLAILLTHEMGHFLATVRYGIPASLPFCLPFPISPIGTLGAVIGMDGMKADRKEMFDIGLAGPLAGLVVAVPIMWIGIQQLDLTQEGHGLFALECPLAVRMTLDYVQPPGYQPGAKIWPSQLNPYFMAGWVGLLITGLNMLPVSQLDGGHVIYTLLGKRAHWVARGFMVVTVAYIFVDFAQAFGWTLMVVLILLIGTDHPPTRDDYVPLGWFRTGLGYASLLIPILCFAPRALMVGS
jgi:Zn-dependent protease